MYGNFDAIKRRKQLRKETTDSRKKRVDDLKGRTSRSKKVNVFPNLDPSAVEATNARLKLRLQKAQRKETIIYAIVFVLATTLVGYLISQYVYPAF